MIPGCLLMQCYIHSCKWGSYQEYSRGMLSQCWWGDRLNSLWCIKWLPWEPCGWVLLLASFSEDANRRKNDSYQATCDWSIPTLQHYTITKGRLPNANLHISVTVSGIVDCILKAKEMVQKRKRIVARVTKLKKRPLLEFAIYRFLRSYWSRWCRDEDDRS